MFAPGVHGQMPNGISRARSSRDGCATTSPLTPRAPTAPHTNRTTLEVNNALQPGDGRSRRRRAAAPSTILRSPATPTAGLPPSSVPELREQTRPCLGVGPIKAWPDAGRRQWRMAGGFGGPGERRHPARVIPQGAGLRTSTCRRRGGAVHLRADGCCAGVRRRAVQQVARHQHRRGRVRPRASRVSPPTRTRPATIDVTYGGPDFGAGTGTMTYATTSTGGEGGHLLR